MPTVEVARQERDPIFWVKADNSSDKYVDHFFLAGYSVDGPPPPFEGPGGGSLNILSLGQFMRGYDRRFYGLMVSEDCGTMRWTEIGDEALEWEGPGALVLRLDESWKPRRCSEVMHGYPDCKLPPPVEAFKDTHFRGLDVREFHAILAEGYRKKVIITDSGRVRERYLAGDIREIVCVCPGERFVTAVTVIAWAPTLDEQECVLMAELSASLAEGRGLGPSITAPGHVLRMAERGIFRLVHDRERFERLPGKWKRRCILLDALDVDVPCEAILEPPVCYMKPFRVFEDEAGLAA
jgi:hypothetical protein